MKIAMDFRVYAKTNGYVPCECFLSTGKCRFEGRPGQPCRNFPCAQKQHPFVSTASTSCSRPRGRAFLLLRHRAATTDIHMRIAQRAALF